MKIKTIIFNFITFSLLLTPIIHAAIDPVKSLLSIASEEDLEGLLEAAETGNLEELQKLIGSGMDPNTADDEGETALILATDNGYFEIVKYLLGRRDVDPDLQNNCGYTALIWASHRGFENIAKLLLKHNADPDLQNNYGKTALIWASIGRDDKVVELLLEHNANPDLQNSYGRTALIWAVIKGDDKVVELLLKHNANTNLQDNEGKTALDRTTNPSIKKMISEEMSRREKIAAEIPPFLREEYEVPPDIADIILEMEGTRPSK